MAVRGAIQVFRDVIARKATPTMVPQPKILSAIAGLRAREWRGWTARVVLVWSGPSSPARWSVEAVLSQGV